MSTRATYEFRSTDGYGPKSVTFYIHYDGYPEGAASYFRAALAFKCEAPNSNFADHFFRANRTELTEGHNAHGDTEYQYTVTQNGPWREEGIWSHRKPLHIVACEVIGFADGKRPARVIFDGAMDEFLARAAVLA